MKQTKHTKGEIITSKYENGAYSVGVAAPKDYARDLIKEIATFHYTSENTDKEEIEANAILTAEAFNIANQTGLTPSELLKQRDELLGALEKIKKRLSKLSKETYFSNPHISSVYQIIDEVNRIFSNR